MYSPGHLRDNLYMHINQYSRRENFEIKIDFTEFYL